MRWGFYDLSGNYIPPLKFSNGKDQEQVVNEILEAFESSDHVFLKAAVGSGKSAIALHVIAGLGKGIISVPVKELQNQYQQDYYKNKYVDIGKGKLKIRLFKGRANFWCVFYGKNAGSAWLPCTRVLDEGESRWSVATCCPFWNPIYSEPKDEGISYKYESVIGSKYYIKRGSGCTYVDQFGGYVDGDILIMNSAKWLVETLMERKPLVDVCVFDESDAWLDSLTFEVSIGVPTINKLKKEDLDFSANLDLVLAGELEPIEFLRELYKALRNRESEYSQELYHKIALILKYEDALEFYIGEKSIKYFIPDPSITLKTLLERSAKKILFMSATAQSKEVLNEIYKIDPVFIEGETKFPGVLIRKRTGKEEVVNYQKWERESFRKRYWQLLQEILEVAQRPVLVNVHAFKYLPRERIGLIPSQDEVREWQDLAIAMFLDEKEKILFTTKLDRGIDLKGEKARSIVMLKYPYPLRNDPILLAMAKRLGKEKFEIYYQDLADRQFIQSVGRVIRSKDDFAEFWSPDLKCHEALLELWKGDIL